MGDFISIKEYMDRKNNELNLYIPFKAAYTDEKTLVDAIIRQYSLADTETKVFGGMTPMLAVGCFAFDSFTKARFAADFCGARSIVNLTIKKKIKGLVSDETFWVPYDSDVDDDYIKRAKKNKEDASYYRMRRINWDKTDLEKLEAQFEITLINVDRETIRMSYANTPSGEEMNLGQFDKNFLSAIQSAYPKRHVTQRRLDKWR